VADPGGHLYKRSHGVGGRFRSGVSKKMKQHLFEPFYSEKSPPSDWDCTFAVTTESVWGDH